MTTITLDVPDTTLSLLNSIGDRLPLVLEMGLSRLAPVSSMAYMEAIELFTQMPSPEAITKFCFSEEVEEQTRLLLERNNAGELTQADEVELDRLVLLEEKLQLIKAKALAKMHQQSQ